jgi:hypothetical protein
MRPNHCILYKNSERLPITTVVEDVAVIEKDEEVFTIEAVRTRLKKQGRLRSRP